uniref:DUF5666 domain-containing protein n=1 Tax=Panagrolaimus sp. ES5 TaxID=591445 RepID=A0AC34G0C9_9BILA
MTYWRYLKYLIDSKFTYDTDKTESQSLQVTTKNDSGPQNDKSKISTTSITETQPTGITIPSAESQTTAPTISQNQNISKENHENKIIQTRAIKIIEKVDPATGRQITDIQSSGPNDIQIDGQTLHLEGKNSFHIIGQNVQIKGSNENVSKVGTKKKLKK